MKMKLSVQLMKITYPYLRSEVYRWLAASMLFSVLLILIRIIYTRELTFIFLTWNLFLAFIPFCISLFLQENSAWVRNKWKFALGFCTWLLFIPNSFYIITDLFHLGISNVPIWFELALILSFAWNGLLLGILSVRQIERIIQCLMPKVHEVIFLLPVMCLNALGIYIGRYLRFNSWDIISNPLALAGDISNLILHPLASRPAWAMISCYTLLMTLIYVSLKKISRSL